MGDKKQKQKTFKRKTRRYSPKHPTSDVCAKPIEHFPGTINTSPRNFPRQSCFLLTGTPERCVNASAQKMPQGQDPNPKSFAIVVPLQQL